MGRSPPFYLCLLEEVCFLAAAPQGPGSRHVEKEDREEGPGPQLTARTEPLWCFAV